MSHTERNRHSPVTLRLAVLSWRASCLRGGREYIAIDISISPEAFAGHLERLKGSGVFNEVKIWVLSFLGICSVRRVRGLGCSTVTIQMKDLITRVLTCFPRCFTFLFQRLGSLGWCGGRGWVGREWVSLRPYRREI